MSIGRKIKELRRTKDMTLKELAERSRVALTTLSRIENDKMKGTVDSHLSISKALGVSLSEFYKELEQEIKKSSIEIQPRQKKADIYTRNKYAAYEILAKNILGKKMMPLLLRVDPGGVTSEEEHQPGTDKFIYIIDGKVQVFISDMKYALNKGDALYFDGSLPHHWKNSGKKQALCLCVIDPPEV